MSTGDPKRQFCPNCPCPSCRPAQFDPLPPLTPIRPLDNWTGPTVVKTGVSEPECAYERFAREYAARGEPMPTTLLLYCGCRKCSLTCT